MMLSVLLILLTVCHGGEVSVQDAWKQFMGMKSETAGVKIVMSGEETKMRFGIFKNNYKAIQSINSEDGTWKAGVNLFSDRTTEERAAFTGLNISLRGEPTFIMPQAALTDHAPTSINWVTKKKVVGIKNQGKCGSCWAFAAVAALESHYAIVGDKLKMMSEQQALDCTYSDEDNYDGCGGGWYTQAWTRIRTKLGNKFPTAESYQYKEVDSGTCVVGRGVNALTAANLDKLEYIAVPYMKKQSGSPYDATLAGAVAVGPVAVAIEVIGAMYSYESGIYSETCSGYVNHAVVVVGYDTKSFLIRNSWGSSWGSKGYISFDRSIQNQCFLAQYPDYPNLKATDGGDGKETTKPCKPNPCQHRGKCKGSGSSYTCKCKKKYTGDQCQEKISKCKDKSNRCPEVKSHKKCLRNWAKRRCKVSCGFCYQ